MTIAPKLLAELEASNEVVEPCLSVESASKADLEKINLDEATFRWMLNEVIFICLKNDHSSYKSILMHEKCGRPDSNEYQHMDYALMSVRLWHFNDGGS